ncbi:AMP-binding protein [Mycolicibacterium arenosum]|uniref:AMP-binding protein n=1 Tax=Mycolicibacterium arenosum TaxID=2952157 RepID=A0ABT1M0K0_9MYCO|nr:AMP-binding protein [Mycolicibacterium sp. CAU 1645]MCP9272681.1 AMP-binding protein [Mycolicibacterium sp. CAU 1645]
MSEATIPAILRERASLQPNDIAFTFVDYDVEWEGVSTSLTWAQLYRRTTNLALALSSVAAIGDRSVIVAPQGLDYLVAFLASLEAGLIAVPLSTPMSGAHDERVGAVMADAAPTVVLTTSVMVDVVSEYARRSDATVIAVDRLDLDMRSRQFRLRGSRPETAYLQYTSGSTRSPAGVMVSYRNLSANFEQIMADFFPEYGKVAPEGTTAVSWLPFYHDMGLMLGVCAPILGGWRTMVTTPLAFLARPARWVQLMASSPNALTAAPNFAFELAAARTTDEDMAGLDLSGVVGLISGAERVHDATLRRFTRRFAKYGLPERALKPCYGLAEATLYVATREPADTPAVVNFELDALAAGRAVTCGPDEGAALVSYGTPVSPEVRIVDPHTRVECSTDTVGEIWTRGENVCLGYWQKPEQTEDTYGGSLVSPSPGTAEGPWLRTGDLGFVHAGELFIIGRIKDLVIVRGRNHYPDDIEATIGEITGGRVAAIAVEEDRTEQLVAIIEVRQRGDTESEVLERMLNVKRQVTSAISTTHGLTPADLVLVPRGAIPITTSGKIRRSAAAQCYRNDEFERLDLGLSTVSG